MVTKAGDGRPCLRRRRSQAPRSDLISRDSLSFPAIRRARQAAQVRRGKSVGPFLARGSDCAAGQARGSALDFSSIDCGGFDERSHLGSRARCVSLRRDPIARCQSRGAGASRAVRGVSRAVLVAGAPKSAPMAGQRVRAPARSETRRRRLRRARPTRVTIMNCQTQ
jgi:hypothetical protein